MPDRPDLLIVASTRRWVADDLAAGCPVPVVHDHGLDAPDLHAATDLHAPELRPAWWTPTEHATRLLRAGVPFAAASPGPAWLSAVEQTLTGRPVWTGPLADIGAAPRAGWCKPAEAKVAALPADWWDDVTEFAAAAATAGLPADAQVQVSPLRLELTEEHRFAVVAGTPTAGSWYLADGQTFDPDAAPAVHAASASAFAADVAAHLAAGGRAPAGYTLDVGRCADGSWVVVEGNPIWSSAPYGCDPAGFTAGLLSAFTAPGAWTWQPDPWLLACAHRRPPLRSSRPTWVDADGRLRDLRPPR